MYPHVYQTLRVDANNRELFHVIKELLAVETEAGSVAISAEAIAPIPSCFEPVSTDPDNLVWNPITAIRTGEWWKRVDGAMTVHEWKVRNWGTPSPLFDVQSWDENFRSLSFRSVATPATGIVKRISEFFPEPTFSLTWMEHRGEWAGAVSYLDGINVLYEKYRRGTERYVQVVEYFWR